MTLDTFLHKPEEKTIAFLDRTLQADVIVTGNKAEAAYYLAGTCEVIAYYEMREGRFTVILHDIGQRVLRKKYGEFQKNSSSPDMYGFLCSYQRIEQRCRGISGKREVKYESH